jgi:hypothetical protein
MRYGIVRDAPFLPPLEEQRRILESLQCDLIMEQCETSVEALRWLDRFLLRAKRGDEIVVQDLLVFLKSTDKLALFLRDLLELEASVVVAPSLEKRFTICRDESVIASLTLLAAHETRRAPVAPNRTPGRRGAPRTKPLSAYQIAYARKLHAEGESLRSIGWLFQISPQEVSEVVSS